MIVTGIRNNGSCIIKEIDCTPQKEGMSTLSIFDLKLDELTQRPTGRGDFVDIPVPVGSLGWYRVRFEPNQVWGMHHTDTIDCHTIVAGSIDLILEEDGPHRLVAGDSVVVTGVDHGWHAGPEGCATSIVILGTPKP